MTNSRVKRVTPCVGGDSSLPSTTCTRHKIEEVVETKGGSPSLSAARQLYGDLNAAGTTPGKTRPRGVYGPRTTPARRKESSQVSQASQVVPVGGNDLPSVKGARKRTPDTPKPSRKRPRKPPSKGPTIGADDDASPAAAAVKATQGSQSRQPRAQTNLRHRDPNLSPMESSLYGRRGTESPSAHKQYEFDKPSISSIFIKEQNVAETESNITANAAVSKLPELAFCDGTSKWSGSDRGDGDGDFLASTPSLAISYADAQAVLLDRSDNDNLSPDDNLSISSTATDETFGLESMYSASVVSVTNPAISRRRVERQRSRRGRRWKRASLPGGVSDDVSWAIDGYWSLTSRERKRNMRHVVLTERTGAARALSLLAGKVNRRAMRTLDLFNMVDRDRDNVLTRAEIHYELATLGLPLDDEKLSNLMAFLDTEDRGYVTFGDLHNSLKMFRTFKGLPREADVLSSAEEGFDEAVHTPSSLLRPSRTRISRASITSCPSSSGRLQAALLTPIALITTSPTFATISKKRRRPMHVSNINHRAVRRGMRWDSSRSILDITDPEIYSLAECLMGVEDSGEARRRVEWQRQSEGEVVCAARQQGTHQETDLGFASPENSSVLGSGESTAHNEDDKQRAVVRCSDTQPVAKPGSANFDTATVELLRPLSFVMSQLKSIAARHVHDAHKTTEHVRGPGSAAVPCSAARVCRVLARLKRLWRESHLRRPCSDEHGLPRSDNNEAAGGGLSDEELDAVVQFFGTDSMGHVRLEDVITVFRAVRRNRVARRRLPAAAVPALVAVGRRLDERGDSAMDFTRQAGAITIIRPKGSDSRPDGANTDGVPPPSAEKVHASTKKAGGRSATVSQVKALLCQEMPGLSEEQRSLVVECVGEDGLVSGKYLAGAVRRARLEASQRRRDWRLQKRRSRAPNPADIGSEIEIEIDKYTTDMAQGVSRSDHRQTEVDLAVAGRFSRCRQRSPRAKTIDADFDHLDAALLLDILIRECGGLRAVNAETMITAWRSLKRHSRGANAYRAGRSAVSGLRRLLRRRSMKPLRWFCALGEDDNVTAAADDSNGRGLRVPVSAVTAGVNNLLMMSTTVTTANAEPANVAAGGEMSFVHDDNRASSNSKNDAKSGHTEVGAEGTGGEEDGDEKEWSDKRLAALAAHLDPCGEGTVTIAGLQDALRDCCEGQQTKYPDVAHLTSARRFEAALRMYGCENVCEMLAHVAGDGRGAHSLIEFVRRMGDCSTRSKLTARDLDAPLREEQAAGAIAQRKEEIQLVSWRALSLREKLARPENAGVGYTMRRIDDVVAAQGKRLVVEFYKADRDGSGEVDTSELKRAMENLVRPCHSLTFERKRKRERHAAAAAAAEMDAADRAKVLGLMERLHQSIAGRFLDTVSYEIRRRRFKIRDVFRDVDAGKSGALGVDDLLNNTQRALGLHLKRPDAEALVAILDLNGDDAIQCDELESALRSYRRYRWERVLAINRTKKYFHEDFPSLVSLFSCGNRTSGGPLRLLASTMTEDVSRDDVIAALKRLRGDSYRKQRRGLSRGARQRSRPFRDDERCLTKALVKIGLSCGAAGVRSGPALAATLAPFDFGPTTVQSNDEQDEARSIRGEKGAGIMRAVDMRQWLWLMTSPMMTAQKTDICCSSSAVTDRGNSALASLDHRNTTPVQQREYFSLENSSDACGSDLEQGGGSGTGGCRTRDYSKANRLLSRKEIGLVLQAVAYRRLAEGAVTAEGGGGSTAAAVATSTNDTDFCVSVPALWELLCTHNTVSREADERWTEESKAAEMEEHARKQARERPEEARRLSDAAVEQNGAALNLQCAIRQRQARKKVEDIRLCHKLTVEKGEKAALTVQRAVRRMQARKRVEGIRTCYKSTIEKREKAALTVQCAVRQMQARARVHEANITREAQARDRERIIAAARIQALERGRQTRARIAARTPTAVEQGKLEDAARRLAAATEERNAARAAVRIQCTVRRKLARQEASHRCMQREEAARKRQRAAEDIAARMVQKAVVRRRLANARRKEVAAEEDARKLAAIEIQRVCRGWLVREELVHAAEKAALEAAITARRAVMVVPAAGAGAAGRAVGGVGAAAASRSTGWRKKSVVGGRAPAGTARLSVVAQDL